MSAENTNVHRVELRQAGRQETGPAKSARQDSARTGSDPAETETKALCARVERFVDEVAIPAEAPGIARNVAELDIRVAMLRARAREAGLYAPQLPPEWGGLGLGWRALAQILEAAGRGFLAPAALNCAAPDQPNMLTLLRLGTPSQQARYLGPLARGEQRACFAMTEPAPGAGSDPSMLRTRARRLGGKWVLNGHKMFISGGVGADFAVVLATTEIGATLFLVDADNPGYQMVRDIGMSTVYQIGGHAEIRLRDCEVDDSAVVGEPGRGLEYAQLRLEPARLLHCMRYIGRARRALDTAQSYVLHRESFGARLADLQQIQAMVADSHIDLHASRLLTLDCAARMDAGISVKQSSAMAKVFVSEAVCRVADRAVQMMGALGLSEDTPVAQVWQELRAFRIYDGANELHRATLARRLLRQHCAAQENKHERH